MMITARLFRCKKKFQLSFEHGNLFSYYADWSSGRTEAGLLKTWVMVKSSSCLGIRLSLKAVIYNPVSSAQYGLSPREEIPETMPLISCRISVNSLPWREASLLAISRNRPKKNATFFLISSRTSFRQKYRGSQFSMTLAIRKVITSVAG